MKKLFLLFLCGVGLGVLFAADPPFFAGGYTPNRNDTRWMVLQRILGFLDANAAANVNPTFLGGHTPNRNDTERTILMKILGALIDGGGGGGSVGVLSNGYSFTKPLTLTGTNVSIDATAVPWTNSLGNVHIVGNTNVAFTNGFAHLGIEPTGVETWALRVQDSAGNTKDVIASASVGADDWVLIGAGGADEAERVFIGTWEFITTHSDGDPNGDVTPTATPPNGWGALLRASDGTVWRNTDGTISGWVELGTVGAGGGGTNFNFATTQFDVVDDTNVFIKTGALLTNAVLTTPAIGNFSSASHSHQNAAGGGSLDGAAIASGTVADARIDGALARDAEVAAAYQPLDADLTDLADASLTGSKVGTGINADNITGGTISGTGGLARTAGATHTDIILSESLIRPDVALGGGTSIDPTLGNWFTKTLTADTTFTFANLADGQVWNVDLTQDSTPRTVTWPTVTWRGGSTPVMDTGSGVVNTFLFRRTGGVTRGDVIQQSDVQMDTIAALGDPGANRILMWDDTDNAYVNAVVGSGLTYTAATDTLSSSGGSSLPADPGVDTVLGWDDTDSTYTNMVLGAGLSYTHATKTLASSGGASLPAIVEWGGTLKEDGTNAFWDVPEQSISYFTDFMGGTAIEHFSASTSGAGSAFTTTGVPDTNSVGVVFGGTGTTTTGYGGFVTQTASIAPSRGVFRFKTRVQLANLSDGTESYVFVAGLHDAVTTNATDGVFFKADSNHTPNWLCVTTKGGGTTDTVDSGVAIAAATWTRLEFVTSANWGIVNFYINGSLVATTTSATSIPITDRTTGIRVAINKYAGTTSRIFTADYCKYQYMLNFTR